MSSTLQIGSFRLGKPIGMGGMGVVWYTEHVQQKYPVAIYVAFQLAKFKGGAPVNLQADTDPNVHRPGPVRRNAGRRLRAHQPLAEYTLSRGQAVDSQTWPYSCHFKIGRWWPSGASPMVHISSKSHPASSKMSAEAKSSSSPLTPSLLPAPTPRSASVVIWSQ